MFLEHHRIQNTGNFDGKVKPQSKEMWRPRTVSTSFTNIIHSTWPIIFIDGHNPLAYDLSPPGVRRDNTAHSMLNMLV